MLRKYYLFIPIISLLWTSLSYAQTTYDLDIVVKTGDTVDGYGPIMDLGQGR